MRHIRLLVQYDGTDYAGFQSQPDQPTIQEELINALRRLLAHDVKIQAASRTDAGVHAMGQVVTFQTTSLIPAERLVIALNDLLPVAISCITAEECSPEFHPQYDARAKLYSYRLLNRLTPSPFIGRYAWHVPVHLDVEAMRSGGTQLIGRHDFAAFCATGSTIRDTVREIYRLEITTDNEVIEARVEGNGFLYMMVRIIIGTLVEVGRGRWEPDRVATILQSQNRDSAGPTAPPQGLCLVKVSY